MSNKHPVERFLEGLYTVFGVIAAVFLALIAIMTLVQIMARQLGMPIETTELSGFCLAGATFFGLAHTLVKGEMVRITLFEGVKIPLFRQTMEIICCILGALVSGALTWFLAKFTHESYVYGDLSPGLMAVPMWIPQMSLVLGFGALTIALLHQLVRLLSKRHALYEGHESPLGE